VISLAGPPAGGLGGGRPQLRIYKTKNGPGPHHGIDAFARNGEGVLPSQGIRFGGTELGRELEPELNDP
jgi:hypothetical protein